MRVSRRSLEAFTPLPADDRELRLLLDDVGLEVKRSERIEVQGQPDTAFDLELLANRGDHHCLAGVARELHGRTGAGLRLPPVAALEVGEGPAARVETPLCLRYSLTPLRLPPGATLPAEALGPLLASGQHSVSAAVDATNLANLELGQPTHVFDAARVEGEVVVRLSREGERAWPLFRPAPVQLPAGTLVIADRVKILAIAGVIGCEESKATAESEQLLLESACFDPVSVRKASRALDLRTEASARFERGADPLAVLAGAGRVVHLLETGAGAVRTGPTTLRGDWVHAERALPFRPEALARQLGLELPAAEMVERLARYGFRHEARESGAVVLVPPARDWDIDGEADLVEELARSVGYNLVPSSLPAVEMGAEPGPVERLRARVDALLVGFGLYEVLCDGFYGNELAGSMPIAEDHPLRAHVRLLNALDKGWSLLKNNALLQLLDGAADGQRRKVKDIGMYEWTRTFHPDPGAENGLCRERPVLGVLGLGDARPASWAGGAMPFDAHFLVGLVEQLGRVLRLPLEVGPGTEVEAPGLSLLHPGRRAVVRLDGEIIGLLGEVHPALARARGIKRGRPAWLELSRDPLLRAPRPAPFVEPPEQPEVTRDLALVLPPGLSVRDVLAAIGEAGPAWLSAARVKDRFVPEGRAEAALTFELSFSLAAGPRTAEELNAAAQTVVEAVVARFGAHGLRAR